MRTILLALKSARIGRLARRLSVSIPDHFYRNIDFPIDGSYRRCLTDEGLAEVLPSIHETARKRRQEFGYWVRLGIGFLGALTGLVAVLT